MELYESGKWSVGDRRILMTHWIAHAWERVHKEHKEAIIKCFLNVGLALPVDGSQDHLLKVRDLPQLTYGDWQKAPEGDKENPIVVNGEAGETIEIDNDDSGYLYTAKEVAEGIITKEEDENNVITDSGMESEEGFDRLSESDFDEEVDGDKDINDENM